MRKMLRKFVSIKHNIVAEAKNGKEAVEKYKDVNPDIVIMDVKMPKMNGFEALSEIKEIDRSQKVMLCTSVDKHDKIENAMDEGADAYIVKPYKKDKLLETIEELIEA